MSRHANFFAIASPTYHTKEIIKKDALCYQVMFDALSRPVNFFAAFIASSMWGSEAVMFPDSSNPAALMT
jgi:hypothetical protein